ncbi:hypothetical protein AG1IA_10001 [Rhizoctonia solani AG-1 IA]|uniref:Uncharacterized protein n=1 Tax=Thanatephorus cucumeris (strain AG1-IA) TaxID=983506 RepID=L8WHV9_THACA|nr:hypothetical protein AG1IA_10001 [Rhizoctonia solani AG-1 IA]
MYGRERYWHLYSKDILVESYRWRSRPTASISSPMKDETARNWVAKEDGWVMGPESEVVLWLPPNLAPRFPVPPCSGIIRDRGCLLADIGNAVYGNGWESCYDAPIKSGIQDM